MVYGPGLKENTFRLDLSYSYTYSTLKFTFKRAVVFGSMQKCLLNITFLVEFSDTRDLRVRSNDNRFVRIYKTFPVNYNRFAKHHESFRSSSSVNC